MQLDEQVMVLLVGEQPAPNLLPVKQYRPKSAVLVYTDFTERITENLQRVLPLKTIWRVKVPPYDVAATRKGLTERFAAQGWKGSDLIFNLTGGTKMMMLAAYSIAQEMGSRCLYLVSERGRNDVHWYKFENGRLVSQGKEPLRENIDLDEYLRAYVGAYRHGKPADKFERAVLAALRPQHSAVDQILTNIRPTATPNLEIDALVRIGNQIGLLEIKQRADKRAIDQLTTPTSREYLGTYVHRFLISGRRMAASSHRLAQAYGITIIELESFGNQQRLSADDTALLRQKISQRLGVAVQKG